jgi:hypothetical protein
VTLLAGCAAAVESPAAGPTSASPTVSTTTTARGSTTTSLSTTTPTTTPADGAAALVMTSAASPVAPLSGPVAPLLVPAAPLRVPTDADPLRVLLLGDGVMWDAAPALTAAFGRLGPTHIDTRAYWGFGLTRPDWQDWPGLWPSLMLDDHPDVVLVSIGTHDAEPRRVGDEVRAPGQPDWQQWYGGLATSAMEMLTADGARVYWGTMLPSPVAAVEEFGRGLDSVLTSVATSVATSRHGATMVATATALSVDGAYTDVDPAAPSHRWRKPDGVHLCAAGAARFAEAYVAAVASDMRRPPVALSVPAEWTADPRYSWDGGRGCAVSGGDA